MIILTVITLLITLVTCQQTHSQAHADIIYFILIDRFIDGDPSNNAGNNPLSHTAFDGTNPESLKSYQGGDLAGIIQSLDDIKAMGVTMVWISPFMDNSNTDYVGWWPYHGYHPIDFYAVDEHFGTLDDLKLLVDTAHEKGLKIIFDMPFNQTAADHPWIENDAKNEWFHRDADGNPHEITDWFDQEQIERGELHGLPDLAQENPDVSQYLFEVSKYWIEETGCDGFRLDAVKHIPLSFWEEYNLRIKSYAGSDFLLLGEVFWGAPERLKPYEDAGFDYLFDLPGYYAIRNTFNKGGSIKDFSEFYEATQNELAGTQFATIIDNHDVARFNVGLGENAWSKQLLALGWLMTSPGIPVIYSGTEVGMTGYDVMSSEGLPQDFLNRLPYPQELSDSEKLKRSQFTALTQLRLSNPVLSSGFFNEIYKDWSIYAYLRSQDERQLLLILNTASTEEFLAVPIPGGLELDQENRLYGEGVVRKESGDYYFRLPPNSLNAWRMGGSLSADIPERVEFTDRLSNDYQTFRISYHDPHAGIERLQVAGDFNNWVAQDYSSFRRNDTLFLDLPLKAGRYQYKLVLNGDNWIADPKAQEFTTDPFGGKNSILTVISG